MNLLEFNLAGKSPIRELTLPHGSYLIVFRREGFWDLRCPVLVERRKLAEVRVRLTTPEQVKNDFVHIPAGPFLSGGDPKASWGFKRKRDWVDDFIISRHEVTCEDYRKFIEAVARQRPDLARERMPRELHGRRAMWTLGDNGKVTFHVPGMKMMPVFGIRWKFAREYCEFLSALHSIDKVVTYRLPTRKEWEKAARGVDGRLYPWGNYFDWTFTNGGESHSDRAKPLPVGAVHKDVSPYGVRDMAGNVAEWCSDGYENARQKNHFLMGSSWGSYDANNFRVAARDWYPEEWVNYSAGFRIVRETGK